MNKAQKYADKMVRKHNSICNNLARRLRTKPNTIVECVNEDYDLGERDVGSSHIISYKSWDAYWEIKCNDKKKARIKGSNQVVRWSGYNYKETGRDSYGIYFTPQSGPIIMAKNGVLRHIEISKMMSRDNSSIDDILNMPDPSDFQSREESARYYIDQIIRENPAVCDWYLAFVRATHVELDPRYHQSYKEKGCDRCGPEAISKKCYVNNIQKSILKPQDI